MCDTAIILCPLLSPHWALITSLPTYPRVPIVQGILVPRGPLYIFFVFIVGFLINTYLSTPGYLQYKVLCHSIYLLYVVECNFYFHSLLIFIHSDLKTLSHGTPLDYNKLAPCSLHIWQIASELAHLN